MGLARRRSSKVQSEAFLVESEHRTIEWSEGRPENQVAARGHGVGLRVIEEGRLGFSYSNRLDSEGVSGLVEFALQGARVTPPDPHQVLPSKPVQPLMSALDLEDPVIRPDSAIDRAHFLETIEAEVKRRDPRLTKVLRASYREGRGNTAIVSSQGIAHSYEGTQASVSLACVAVEGAETQVGYAFQAARHVSDLNVPWVIDQAVDGTLCLLGGKLVPSGRYDLAFDPLVGAEMIELLATALRGDQVQKGRSFLASQLGKSIGANHVTIIDDGCLRRGLGSSPVDAEGLPTQTTVVVDQGVLKGFLYDSVTARKSKTQSTGNAGRASYKGLPEPDASNFYLKPGSLTQNAILSQVSSGIFVRQVMGLHTVDTVSGDFSLGIMGQRIENGKRTHGVRGVTIAGNFLELLKNVEAVGSDLVFSGSVGASTLWIRGISVGGS